MKLFSSDNDIRKGIGFLPLLLCLLPTVQTVTPLWSEPLLYGSAIGCVLCAFFCIYGLCRGKRDKGWVSLGKTVATGKTVAFRGPKNALFWLRDLTQGKEEQVFFYENGKQVFSYDIK